MYIYPDNLKAKAVMWLWELRDIVIITVSAIISIIILTQSGFLVPLAGTAGYAFLAIKVDDASVLMFLKNAWKYFISTNQFYEWRMSYV